MKAWGALALVGALLVAGACTEEPSDHGPTLDPPAVAYQPPQYAAPVADGLLVRHGSESRVLYRVAAGEWLPDGSYLARILHRDSCPKRWVGPCRRYPAYTLDVGNGPLTEVGMGLTDQEVGLPVATVWGLSWLPAAAQTPLWRASPDLSRRMPDLQLPPVDGPADERYYGEPVTIGDATFVEFSDVVADHYEEYGYLRIVGDEVEKVLVGQRITRLWPSADRRSLLATQQLSGDPCGGCIASQQIVEIDPTTGEIAEEYGVPDGYDRFWGVHAVDKVGGRVAVRFGRSPHNQVGLWVNEDGTWSPVEGSAQVLTWWQGPDDRLELRLDPTGGPDRARLFWVHGGEETALPGENQPGPLQVPGSLLPPSD